MLADLAEQVARDGEGARKLVEIIVEGATSKASARKIAMSIANSPLVKTAIAGEDANWGRVVMAVGKAGEPADRDKLSISFNGIRVATSGARDPSYDETEVSAAMKKPEIQIKVAPRPRQRPRPRADLRPHQGIRRDQRRLSVVNVRAAAITLPWRGRVARAASGAGWRRVHPPCLRLTRSRRPSRCADWPSTLAFAEAGRPSFQSSRLPSCGRVVKSAVHG